MSEECVPNETNSQCNYLEVSAVLHSYLSTESLNDVVYPAHLVGDYRDLDENRRKEWYGYTSQTLFGACAIYVSEILERSLKPKEAGFIAGRVEAIIKGNIYG